MIGVSIIVPVFRTPLPLLRKCLDGLLAQSLREIQIIAVNDASPDECPKVLDEYAARDSRITVIHRAVNGRAGAARNDGLAKAVGDYVLFADADDVARPDMCEKLLTLARKHRADIVACSFTVHDTSGTCIGKGYWPERQYDLTDPDQQVQAARHLRHVLWNKLFRREMMAGLRFESFPANIGEDAVFNVACFTRSKVMITTSYYGYCYVAHPTSACSRPSKGLPYLKTSVAAHQAIVRLLKESGAEQVLNSYGGVWALGRFAEGCKWIVDERDASTRSMMWHYWVENLQGNVLPSLQWRRVLGLGYRCLLATGNLRLVSQTSRLLYRFMSFSRFHALRDEIEARIVTRV